MKLKYAVLAVITYVLTIPVISQQVVPKTKVTTLPKAATKAAKPIPSDTAFNNTIDALFDLGSRNFTELVIEKNLESNSYEKEKRYSTNLTIPDMGKMTLIIPPMYNTKLSCHTILPQKEAEQLYNLIDTKLIQYYKGILTREVNSKGTKVKYMSNRAITLYVSIDKEPYDIEKTGPQGYIVKLYATSN